MLFQVPPANTPEAKSEVKPEAKSKVKPEVKSEPINDEDKFKTKAPHKKVETESFFEGTKVKTESVDGKTKVKNNFGSKDLRTRSLAYTREKIQDLEKETKILEVSTSRKDETKLCRLKYTGYFQK